MKPFDHQTGQHLQVDNARIYVEQAGSPDAYPVLYLPGGFGHIAEFNLMMPELPESIQLIGIDSRGHGKSTMGNRGLTYAQLENDVCAIVRQLDLKRLSVIGYSDGGIVAMRLAASRRLEIDKVVAIGAHWQLKAHDPIREVFSQITPESWRVEAPDDYDEYIALNPEPDFDRFTRDVVNMWLDTDPATGYPNETVSRITSELLIVRGDDDPYITPGSMAELATLVSRSHLCNLPFAEHAVHEDQPELLGRILDHFFSDLSFSKQDRRSMITR
ncbi:MAG: alpha/beta fold hydrolase [Phycisphaeraceae bacterium JB051]